MADIVLEFALGCHCPSIFARAAGVKEFGCVVVGQANGDTGHAHGIAIDHGRTGGTESKESGESFDHDRSSINKPAPINRMQAQKPKAIRYSIMAYSPSVQHQADNIASKLEVAIASVAHPILDRGIEHGIDGLQ